MQTALTEIGIKADLTDSQLKQLRKGIAGLAPATNQTMQDLTAGVDAMVTLGLSAKDVAAALPAIGRAATATVSSMSDLSAASVSAMQNMSVTAGDANRADGTVSEAYVRRMQTANEKLKAFQIRLSGLGASVGNRVLGPLGDSAEYLTGIFDTLDERVGVFDRISAAAKAFVAGLGFNADDAGGVKGIIEYFAGMKTSADQVGEELGRIAAKFRKAEEDVRASINGLSLTGMPDLSGMFKGMTIDPTTIAAIGAAAFALRRMAGAMARLAFSTPVKLALLAGGLSTLAGGAKDMSAVDWVTLAAGLSVFAGSLKKFGAVAGILAGIAAIKEFGPKVAEKRREPNPGEPLDYINRVAGYDVTKSREERRAALKPGGMADRQKDDDAVAGMSKREREVATTPNIKVPLLEMPTNPAIFNELDRASRQAAETGRQIDQALSLTVAPTVDTSSMQNALIIANALRAAMASIGSAGTSRGGPAGSNKLKVGGPRAEGGPIRQGMNYLVGERGGGGRPGIGGVQVGKIEINVQGGGNAEEIGRIAGIEIRKLDQQLRRSRHISIDGRGGLRILTRIAPLQIDNWLRRRPLALLGEFRDRRRIRAFDLVLEIGDRNVRDSDGLNHLVLR
jgi:hypothetical protein